MGFLSKAEAAYNHYVIGPLMFSMSWWTCAITLTMINRFLLAPEHLDFPYPMFMTIFHALSMALFIRCVFSKPTEPLSSAEFWRYILPAGIMAGLDITLTNAAFMFMNITFVTIFKSTSLVWIVVIAVFLKLETPSCWLIISTLFIVVGVLLVGLSEVLYPENSNKELDLGYNYDETGEEAKITTRFSLVGGFIAFCASWAAAARWTILQYLMQEGRHLTVQETLYYIMPIQGLSIVPFFLIFELPSLIKLKSNADTDALIALFLFSGFFLAIGLTASEFLLIKRTSTITLSIIGSLKELATIVTAIIFFGERVTTMNIFGLVICLIGVFYYKYQRYQSIQAKKTGNENNNNTNASNNDGDVVIDINGEDEDSEDDIIELLPIKK